MMLSKEPSRSYRPCKCSPLVSSLSQPIKHGAVQVVACSMFRYAGMYAGAQAEGEGPRALSQLGLALSGLGEYVEAEQVYRRALKLKRKVSRPDPIQCQSTLRNPHMGTITPIDGNQRSLK
jgi:hypothetical protein